MQTATHQPFGLAKSLTDQDTSIRDKFRTGDTPLIGRVSYLVNMPYALWFIAEVADALTSLTNYDNWIQAGAVTIDEATEAASTLLEGFKPMLGSIFPFATALTPGNMLLCDGSTYNRVDYPDLYDVLDSAFIIDADTFRVPNMINRVSVGAGGDYSVGDTGGEKEHTLTVGEMPSHQHSIDGYVPGLAFAPGELPVFTDVAVPSGTGFTGGGGAHNNMQPYLAVKWGIVAL